jgi:GDP-L-fucose synthase
MKKNVLVTGGNGLVGSAIQAVEKQYPDFAFYYATHQDADLIKQEEVKKLFDWIRPNYVIHTAARVGGIGKNLASPAEQFYHNILMNTFVIDEAYKHGVKKLLAFSSVCAFPDGAPVIKEEILHDGPPYYAHGSYAYSKRMVDVQIKAYRQQYGVKYTSVLPVNIFGEADNYDLEQGHVIPSLIHRCQKAMEEGKPLQVWGTGIARREFCYAQDLARVCDELLRMNGETPDLLIVSNSREYTIKEIVAKVCKAFNYNEVEWLTDKPNGQLSRPSDTARFKKYFPDFNFTDIDEAIQKSVDWFKLYYPRVRGAH